MKPRHPFRALFPLLAAIAFGGQLAAQTATPVVVPSPVAIPPFPATTGIPAPASLDAARRGFVTRLVRRDAEGVPVPLPPPALFATVRYPARPGALAAYLSRPPRAAANGAAPGAGPNGKHPAILWLVGGWGNGIGLTPWAPAPPENDQSAGAFWKAGVLTMYPARRGGNDNPGFQEGFYGEVDDVLAAAEFLARQPGVDPARIYLGGHSTGATLALLVAECAPAGRFRGVFAFGPEADLIGLGKRHPLPFDQANPREFELRSPELWLAGIRVPTFVFEGETAPANLGSLRKMARGNVNPLVHFFPVKGRDHFSVLGPGCRLAAEKILHDAGNAGAAAIPGGITFSEGELNAP